MPIERTKSERRKIPRLRQDLQESILRFLAGKKAMAEQALARCTADRDRLIAHIDLSRNVDYWTDVISCINWLAESVPERQHYLTILDPENKDSQCQ